MTAACTSGEEGPAPGQPPAPEATDGRAGTDPPVAVVATPIATPVPDVPLEQKIAEMIMLGFDGTTLAEAGDIAGALEGGLAANVVLFDRNVASPAQLAELTAGVDRLTANAALVSSDQEGGYVARLRPDKGFPETVSAEYLGHRDPGLTYEYSSAMAVALGTAGINLNLAPVVDVNVYPESPAIGFYERSFSADPDAVAEHALAFIRAHHDHGVLTTLKHFAGHGSAREDSHLGITDVTGTWSQDELIPFRSVIEAGEADAIMTAHLVNAQIDPEHPGTLSARTITGILREELGFDGVVITDDMQMGAIREAYGYEHSLELAILAGADILAVANMLEYDPGLARRTFDAVLGAVQRGAISEERIDQSYRRVMQLKSRIA